MAELVGSVEDPSASLLVDLRTSMLSLWTVHGTHPLVGFAFTLVALIPTGMITAVFIR